MYLLLKVFCLRQIYPYQMVNFVTSPKIKKKINKDESNEVNIKCLTLQSSSFHCSTVCPGRPNITSMDTWFGKISLAFSKHLSVKKIKKFLSNP